MKFLLFFMLLIPISVFGASEAGTVSMAAGHPKIVRAGSNNLTYLIYGDKVFVGDKIVTGLTGRVKLLLDDGSILTIGNNSVFKINRFIVGNGKRKSVFSLFKGKMKAVVKRFITKGSGFFVKTPTAVAGVRGTTFVVEANKGKTNVYLINGELNVWNNGNKRNALVLKSGMSTTVIKGKAPTSPRSYRRSLVNSLIGSGSENTDALEERVVDVVKNRIVPSENKNVGLGNEGRQLESGGVLPLIPLEPSKIKRSSVSIKIGF